jgi:hypothetical protein
VYNRQERSFTQSQGPQPVHEFIVFTAPTKKRFVMSANLEVSVSCDGDWRGIILHHLRNLTQRVEVMVGPDLARCCFVQIKDVSGQTQGIEAASQPRGNARGKPRRHNHVGVVQDKESATCSPGTNI